VKVKRIVSYALSAGKCPDVVIAASGYETRARYVADKLGEIGQRRICFGFREHAEVETRKRNDKVFKEYNYEAIPASGGNGDEICPVMENVIAKMCKSQRVLIDISSMSRPWCGTIVKALYEAKGKEEITTLFTYAPAKTFLTDKPYPANEVAGPVRGFSALAPPDKPSALIVGLGLDADRALGISELLDPARLTVFYTKPALMEKYEREIEEVNADLLGRVRKSDIVKYPLRQPDQAIALLDSVCGALRRDYRVVLVSVGPKIFGLACMLVARRYKDVSVWRVSAGSRESVQDRQAAGDICCLEVEWTPD
jgi:hypothetical protein